MAELHFHMDSLLARKLEDKGLIMYDWHTGQAFTTDKGDAIIEEFLTNLANLG